jgi:hypothetical protein
MTEEDGEASKRLWLLVTGVLLVTMPAFTLVVAYAVLSATQSAIVERVSPIEILELYLVELAAFAVFSYVLYRLTRYSSLRYRLSHHDSGPSREEKSRPR